MPRCYCNAASRWWNPASSETHSVECESARQAAILANPRRIFRIDEDVPVADLGHGYRAWDGSMAWFRVP